MQTYLRLLGYVRPHLAILGIAAGCMLASSFLLNGVSLSLVIPFVDRVISQQPIVFAVPLPAQLQALVDWLNGLPRTQLLNYLTVAMVIAFFFKELFAYAQGYFMNLTSLRVIRDIRQAIYGKLLTLSFDFFTKTPTGALVSRITYDTGVIQNSISEGLTDLIFQTTQIIICLAVVFGVTIGFGIPWWIVGMTLVLLPLIMVPIIRIGKRLRRIATATQEQAADIATMLYETISGVRVVQAFGMEPEERRRFAELNDRFFKTMMKSVKRMIAIGPISEYVGLTMSVVILWFGGREVVSDRLSAGAFLTFLAALLSLVRPFNRLSRVHSVNQQALAAATRIFELVDTQPTVRELAGARAMPPFRGSIVYDQVSFAYGSVQALEDMSFEVRQGEVLAIVGPSGAGKTTLVNLLPRFYDPQRGSILIDDTDIRQATLPSLRGQIGLVTQETVLFHATVAENIAYGRQGASREELIRAASLANAHDFIMRLPQQYDTVVGERGYALSGGERQRIAIARALVKNPPILILDEATSQIDTESERLIQQAIERLMKGRTVLVIAHRLSTIAHATRIIVLDRGRMVEQGTHDELMQRQGLYSHLYELQFQ